MIKILFCSPRGSVGGICRWTEHILAYADKVGESDMSLHWYYTDVPEMKVGRRSLIGRVFSGIRVYLPFLKGLKRTIRQGKYDVVHFSTSGSFSFVRDYYSLKMCKKAGMKTALHFHFGRMADVLAGNSLEKKLFMRCMPYIDNYVAMDMNSYSALKKLGCENVHLVPNPLSPEIEQIINKTPTPARVKGLLLFAGHVLRTKGVFELVEACRDIPDIQLEIMGQCAAETESELKALAGCDAEKWLKIRGNCTVQQVIEAMKRCSAFVLPSYSEGFPNVIIEAMACGTPIVATPVGAIPQMLTLENGSLCGEITPQRDVPKLREAIIRVLDDVETANAMGQAAQKRVREEYSMPIVWSKLKEIWIH